MASNHAVLDKAENGTNVWTNLYYKKSKVMVQWSKDDPCMYVCQQFIRGQKVIVEVKRSIADCWVSRGVTGKGCMDDVV